MYTIRRNSRTLGVFVAGVAVLAFLAVWSSRSHAEIPSASTPSSDITKLQQEHLAALREASQLEQRLVVTGAGSIEESTRLNHMLVEAELKYAATGDERISILRNALTAAKEQEKTASQRADVGSATAVEVLEAKAYRLSIEVSLAEEAAK